MKQTRLVSGRVVVKNPGEVAQDRYQFLDLSSSEPNLGTASNGSILTTNTSGERIFTTNVTIDNATLSGNLRANAVYTENLFYANGQPYVTGGAGPTVSSNIFNGRVTVTNAQTLIDSFDLTGITSVRWVLSATDTVNDAYKTSTVDSSNDTVNIYYNEFGIVLSNPNIEVANYYAEIDGSTIKLYGTGTSISVPVTFQRTTLGSSTTLGNIQAVSYIAGTVGSGTATVVNVDNFVGTGSDTAFTLSVTPSAKNQTLIAIGGIVQPKSTYTLAGNVITFSSAPPTGAPVEIQTFVTTTVTGYAGSRGADGIIGYNGSTGYTGSRGIDGVIGYNGSIGYTGSIGFTGSAAAYTNWTKKTSNYTAVSGDRLIADTSAGTFIITLPATPGLGSVVRITDGSNFGTTPLTVGANGSTIESQADDVLVDVGSVDLEFIYDGTTWQIISTSGPIGFTGSSGTNGFTGSAGVNGFTGSAGVNGFTGSTGTFSGTTSQQIITSNTTVSTQVGTGALQVQGGGSIGGNLSIGGDVFVTGNILPTSNNTINLGSPTNRFNKLYIAAQTIDLGGQTQITSDIIGQLQFITNSGNVTLTANSINFLQTVANSTTASGDITAIGNIVASQNLTVSGNLVVQGNTVVVNSQDFAVEDSTIAIHTPPNLGPLIANDGKDIGLTLHYYDTADRQAFFGRKNATNRLVYYQTASESAGNIFSGTPGAFEVGSVYADSYFYANGTPYLNTGPAGATGSIGYTGSQGSTGTFSGSTTTAIITSNTTPAMSTTTGALQVAGGGSIQGTLYIGGDLRVSGSIFGGFAFVITKADFPGPLTVFNGTNRFYCFTTAAITQLQFYALSAPTGSGVTARLNKNGSPVTTITLPAGNVYVSVTGLNISTTSGDYLTVDITQIGSTLPGADASLQIIGTAS